MPTPLTFRSINLPAFNTSGLNAASSAFASAGQGFAELTDQLRRDTEREDELRTNEAISAALSGGPSISTDRRVDAEALRSSVAARDITKSDLSSAKLSRALTGIETEQAQFNLDSAPAKLDADLKQKLASAEASRLRGDFASFQLQSAEAADLRATKLREGRLGAERDFDALFAGQVKFELDQVPGIVEDLKRQGFSPEEIRTRVRDIAANARAEGFARVGDLIPEFLQRTKTKYGLTDADLQGTTAKQISDVALQASATEAASRQVDQRATDKFVSGVIRSARNQDISGIILDSNGNARPAQNKEEKAGNKLSDTKGDLSAVIAQQFNVELDDDLVAAQRVLKTVDGNRSAFIQAVNNSKDVSEPLLGFGGGKTTIDWKAAQLQANIQKTALTQFANTFNDQEPLRGFSTADVAAGLREGTADVDFLSSEAAVTPITTPTDDVSPTPPVSRVDQFVNTLQGAQSRFDNLINDKSFTGSSKLRNLRNKATSGTGTLASQETALNRFLKALEQAESSRSLQDRNAAAIAAGFRSAVQKSREEQAEIADLRKRLEQER